MKLNPPKNEARTTLVNVANHNRFKRKGKLTNEDSCETYTAFTTERGKIRRRKQVTSSFGLASKLSFANSSRAENVRNDERDGCLPKTLRGENTSK